jgi:hypothetical protein
MDFFEKIARLLKTPTKYFSTVKKEGLKEPVVFYLIFTAVVGLLSAASQIKTFQISAGWYPFMYVAIVLFGMIGAFIGAGITHLFVMLFKGKGTYIDTFKARAYGSVPSLLWAIPMVAMILVISSEIGVILVSILSIFPAIYSIYLEVVGLSILHKISKGKAFGAIILPIIIIFTLAFVFFFFVMMAVLAGGM